MKIDTLIMGSQKAGSSSLLHYLSSHPDIISHGNTLEFPYFSDSEIYKKGFQKAVDYSFLNSSNKYNKHILCKSAAALHTYKSFKRIYDHNDKIKLFCILRNPIDRAYSAFWYAKRCGYEKRKSFDDAIKNCNPSIYNNNLQKRYCSYLFVGEYNNHINQLLNYFSKSQIQIILFEDLISNTDIICKDFFNQNNLSNHNIDFTKVHNKKKTSRIPQFTKFLLGRNKIKKTINNILPFSDNYKRKIKKKIIKLNEVNSDTPSMDNETRLFMLDYYKNHNIKLGNFLNKNLSQWNQ